MMRMRLMLMRMMLMSLYFSFFAVGVNEPPTGKGPVLREYKGFGSADLFWA
jgi:hypothetical protein